MPNRILQMQAMNAFEKSLPKEYKKDNGIFYTDIKLAQLMIKDIDIPLSATILDPCCGAGSFILALSSFRYKNVYGADQDDKAVNFCNRHRLPHKCIAVDTIGLSGESTLRSLGLFEKLDYVIGNPPYVPLTNTVKLETTDIRFQQTVFSSGKNLFIAALLRAFELLKPEGILSYIIPKNFLHVLAYSSVRKKILKEKTIISIVDIGMFFKDVRGEQIILTLKNSCSSDNTIIIKKFDNDQIIPIVEIKQLFFKDELLLFSCKEDFSIYKKLTSQFSTFNSVCNGYVGRGKSRSKNAIHGKNIRKFGYKDRNTPTTGNTVFIQNIYSAEAGIIAAFGGNLEAKETVTVFTDGDEKMCHYILGLFHSRICNFFLLSYCYNHSKLTMHTDAKYLKKLPFPIYTGKNFDTILTIVSELEFLSYMTDRWFQKLEELNQVVFQAYDLSPEEVLFINTHMKNFQSQKWYK